MYFLDRLTLGKTLAGAVGTLKGSETVVVCLKEKSMLTAISMAIDLRGWVYLLQFENIADPRDETKILGAITIEGTFVLNPAISEYELQEIQLDFFGILEDRKREAMQRLNARADRYDGMLDKHALNGRNVILVGDIVTTSLELAVASELLKVLRPAGIYGLAGNVTVDVSDQFNMNTNVAHLLDVIPTTFMDDDHYFERPDGYSDDEKRTLALNVSTYWT